MRKAKLAFYFLSRAFQLFRLARWLTRDRLKILCYHGFEMKDEAAFRPKLFIAPHEFERRLATIRRYGLRVLPLDEAVERMYAGTLPRDAVVITIDDGFYSVHEKAAPALHRFGYPSTVYVTTYYVERPNPVFRLAVQYMFASTRRRLLALDGLPWAGAGTLDLCDVAATARATWDCIGYGEARAEQDRVALCEQLGERLGVPYAEVVGSKAFALMTPAQLGELASLGMSVGLHTHRHVLPAGDREAVHREIADNRAALERLVGAPLPHFCYPSGMWDRRQWEWLDEAGVKSSTTCLPGLNSPDTPRHSLRRFLDGANIHQLEFEAALSGFSDLLRALAEWRPGRVSGAQQPVPGFDSNELRPGTRAG